MKEDENDQDLRVTDRRRFVIDEKGEVNVRPGEGGGPEAKPEDGEARPEAPPQEPPREKKRGFFRRKEKTREEKPAADGGPACGPPGEIDFCGFILSLSTSVMIHLGEVPDPMTREVQMELPLARQTIDILGMLREKTKGNLTSEEEMLFNDLLADLRMRYVEKVKKYGEPAK